MSNIIFKDPDSNLEIEKDDAWDFVNNYFATLAERVCKPEDKLPYHPNVLLDTRFEFLPPERY